MFHLASDSVNLYLIQLFGCCLKVLFRRSLEEPEVACCVLVQVVDCGGPELRTEMGTQTILLAFLSLHRDLPSKPWHEGHSFFQSLLYFYSLFKRRCLGDKHDTGSKEERQASFPVAEILPCCSSLHLLLL